MAKRARRNGKAKRRTASGVVVAMQQRFGSQRTNHGNPKRKAARDRKAWRRDHEQNGD